MSPSPTTWYAMCTSPLCAYRTGGGVPVTVAKDTDGLRDGPCDAGAPCVQSVAELGHHVAGECLDLGSTRFGPTADEVAEAGVAPLPGVLPSGVEVVERK